MLKRRRTALMLSGGLLALVTANPAMAQAVDALPTGGTVVAGDATIGTPSGGRLDVNQTSNRAVIDWSRFDIGQGAEVAFTQPSTTAIALNRVTGGDAPSQIAGKLTAHGIVAVLNANGVLFAGTADVNVGGLIASTGQVDTSAFMTGNLLGITGANGGEIIVSAGANISIANAGLAAFVAPTVRNSGTITATAGRVQLGAGTAFTLDLASDGLLQIGVGADSPLVENLGSVFASGGQIQLSARQASALVDQTIRTGVLPVGSARLDGNTIVLDATGSDVQLTSNITGNGNLVLSGSRIYGSGDINVDGDLTLNVNAGGAVADTITGGNNWIGDALGVIGAPVDAATINLGAGSYAAGATINTANVTVNGGGAATIELPLTGGAINGLNVGANGDGATITGIDFAGTIDVPAWTYAWGSSITRGIALANGAENVTVTGNTITGVRNGILVDGRNAGSSITGNFIDNTKSAISVQYSNGATDGPALDIAGNSEGAFGNEWGVIYHLNGHLNGTTAVSSQGAGGAATPLEEQQRLFDVSAANGGMSVFNNGYTASNRTEVTVAPTGGASAQGSFATPISSVQGGVNAVVAGGLVNVMPGNYTEGVTGVDYFGGTGGQKFGLYIAKDDITLRGLDAGGNAIASADDVAAFITAQYQAGFGAQHFVSGTNVTIEGLGFKPVAGGDNKMLEVIGDNFTLRNSVLDARGNGVSANFYISSFETPGADVVERFTLEDNLIYGATLPYDGVSGAGAIVTIAGGVGRNTDASNRVFSGNRIIGGNLVGQRGFQIQGRIPTTAWQQLMSGAVTITGNSFDNVDIPVRTIGLLTEALDWDDVFRNDGNLFLDGAVLAYAGDTLTARATLTPAGDQDFRITSRIQDSVNRALAGDTVRMLDGTYNLGTSQLVLNRGINLIGQSQGGTIIDGRAVSANGLGTISVLADNFSLGNFTLYGSETSLGNYGIKVQPNPAGHVNTAGGNDQRVYNFSISDVTVRGSRRAELDLNGVVGATITNFTADGRRVADGTETAGAGVQITDSSDVTLSGVHTFANTWGSVALYQSNKASGYDGQTTNINIDASANQFDEALGLFSQLESTTQGFGQLNLTGFDHAVRNTDHRPDDLDGQFVFYRTTLDDALAFATGVGNAGASSIEGYTGTGFSNVFTVANGLSINSAIRDARAGGIVNVGAGTYGETVSINKALTLDGAGMDATAITGGMLISGSPTGLVLRDFTVSGSGGTAVINNSGTITGLTVDGVRIDGQNVADRHGFIGGQIGGDIAVTNSEFRNIRGWAAFDTRSGARGNDGAQIASALFANNLIDNTIGHIAFRQQIGATSLPDIVFSGNTLTNTGNATNSFGAIFKAFNADQVDFTGNTVSGVGTSGMVVPTGEAAYGAVLMTRGTAVLNVTGNTFTGNNQVFAVEPGRGLPGSTNLADNTFVDNGYAIYLPGGLTGSGTINFGAGNNFVAGPNTVRHIVWRSAAGLDLTSVSFGGTLASELDLDQLFAVADLVTDGIDVAGAGLARLVDGQLYVTTGSGTNAALRALALGSNGDTLNLSAGTHVLTNTLFLTKDIDVAGQGKGVTVIDASGHNSYGIRVHADDVALSGFSLLGSAGAGNATYGIKVESGGASTERNTGFSIADVAISGSRKTGLDINAAVGVTIDGVDVSGVIAGNGISITDSADVTVSNVTTSGNAWGGLALYQSNNLAGGGSDAQLTNVTATGSTFGEASGLYLQDSSTLHDVGTLNLPDFAFTVRNAAHRTDGAQFTFFRTSVQDALNFAVNLNPAASDASVVQGWTGTGNSGEFVVGFGSLNGGGLKALSLQTAFDTSSAGDSIYVGSGIYNQTATLDGSRTLTFGEATFDGLTFTGESINLSGTLASLGDLALGNVILTGGTSLTTGGALSLAGASGAYDLTLSGNAITLGATNVASLTATAASIATNGVITSGAQSYTGATALNGGYAASTFTIDSGATLLGLTGILASGDVTLGAIEGPYGLLVSGNALTFGPANIGSLNATGATILTSGVLTSGYQVYNGATILSGSYDAAGFIVNGATTLASETALTALGEVTLGNVDGAHGLTVSGEGVLLGAANLASLATTGSTIATNGVVTSGAQSYAGATTLNGGYAASAFAIDGGATLSGLTGIFASGDVTLGAIEGPYGLLVSGNALTFGPANIGSLSAVGTNIVTNGVTTEGTQRYIGATTLNGGYRGESLEVNGATTLGGATTIAALGDVTLGTVGGAQALVVGADTVTLGATNIASLAATGSTIATNGVITSGAQSYTGATTLGGDYSASTFSVTGATTLDAATTIAASGNVVLGTITGPQALTVSGNIVTLGAANIGSLTATGRYTDPGSAIITSGVITTGAQTYTGKLTLTGVYQASSFSAPDYRMFLGGDTSISVTGSADIGWIHDSVDRRPYNFSVAGSRVAINNIGMDAPLGALTIAADEIVLVGTYYRSNSIKLSGGQGATVRLTGVNTIFNTGAAGGDIEVTSHLIGTENGKQNVSFTTGSGLATDGDILLGNLGTADVRLGNLSVTGGDFSAATVKLAGNFKSRLGGNQVFSSQTLDTLGDVEVNVAGSESGPIVAGGAVSVVAGGSGTGSIIAGGPVELAYSSEVDRAITSQSSVSLAATGPVTGSIAATGPVGVSATGPVSAAVSTQGNATISSVTGVSSNVSAGGGVSLTSSQGAVSSQVSSGGTVNVNASGPVTGSITATGPVAVSATGPVSTTVKTDNSASISSVTGVQSNVTAGGAVNLTSTQGAVSSQVSSGGTVNVNAVGPVSGSITATGPVAVAATGPVSTTVQTQNSAGISSVAGVTSNVTAGQGVQVTSTQGAVGGSINAGGAVNVTATGPVSATVSTTGAATIASTSSVSSTVNAGGGVNVTATTGAVTGSITSGGAVAVSASGPVSAAVSATGAANVVSTSGGVSSTINAGGPVSVAAPGPVTSSITSGSTVELTSSTPINVQINGGAVTVNAPGGQVAGNFGQITTDPRGNFVVNDQPVIGTGTTDARQIINDHFLAPVGGTIGGSGRLVFPSGFALALLPPNALASTGRPPVVVNSVGRLGELLRAGYTAIIIQIDEDDRWRHAQDEVVED